MLADDDKNVLNVPTGVLQCPGELREQSSCPQDFGGKLWAGETGTGVMHISWGTDILKNPVVMAAEPRKKRKNFSLVRNDEPMETLVNETDQRTLAAWAIGCAERVLPFFEEQFPEDPRPRDALATLRAWMASGEFHMAVIRSASLAAHAAARDAGEDTPARSAARAAGQAVATAHVSSHSRGAAIYAQQAVWRAADPARADAAVARERDWQYRCLVELREAS